MENVERDTKFSAASKLLFEELKDADDPEKLLAGRLYDLATFVMNNLNSYDYDAHPWDLMDCIPELTGWTSQDLSTVDRKIDHGDLPKDFWKKFWEDPNAHS